MEVKIRRPDMLTAEQTARVIQRVLAQRQGTDPRVVRRFVLTEHEGMVWLFAVLDDRQLTTLTPYTSAETLHHLSTALRGKPVLLSNSTGLRYAVLLRRPPAPPAKVPLPEWKQGIVQIGLNMRSKPIEADWDELGHVLVGGITRFGKSNFLRVLAWQAAQEGFRLALADPDGRTFPLFAGHPALLAPIGDTPEGSVRVLDAVLAEIRRRAALYGALPQQPDTLEAYNRLAAEPPPRVLVVVDEYNGLALATGGARGEAGSRAMQIAWRGAKFGVQMVLAGQTFEKAIVGPVRDQMRTRVAFKMATASQSRIVIGKAGAEKLNRPGLALTDAWGVVQTYWLQPTRLIGETRSSGLTEDEERLARWLLDNANGRMTREALKRYGLGEREARRLRKEWEDRGLAERRPDQDNALCLNEGLARRLRREKGK